MDMKNSKRVVGAIFVGVFGLLMCVILWVGVSAPAASAPITPPCTNGNGVACQTVTINVTKTVTLPQKTTTKTATKTVTKVRNRFFTVTQPARVYTVPAKTVMKTTTLPQKTVTAKPVTSVSVVGLPEAIELEKIVLTPTRAVVISTGFTVLGSLITLFVIWLAYRLGYIRGDAGNRKFIEELHDEVATSTHNKV